MLTTNNLKLKKPELSDNINVDDFNQNSDTIDIEITNLKNDMKTHKHSPAAINQDTNNRFVTDKQIETWNSKANSNHGNHVPGIEPVNTLRFLGNDNTWKNLPNASTSTQGVVKLNSSISSTSTVESATPSAVKSAYDKGVEGVNLANSVKSSLATTDTNLKNHNHNATYPTKHATSKIIYVNGVNLYLDGTRPADAPNGSISFG